MSQERASQQISHDAKKKEETFSSQDKVTLVPSDFEDLDCLWGCSIILARLPAPSEPDNYQLQVGASSC